MKGGGESLGMLSEGIEEDLALSRFRLAYAKRRCSSVLVIE